MLNTTCPNCHAPFARKISIVYEEGISSTSSEASYISETNTILKTKITTQGGSSGTNQTELSKNLAPPMYLDEGPVSASETTASHFGILGLIIGFIFGFYFGDNILSKVFFALVFGFISLFSANAIFTKEPTKKEREEHEKEMAPLKKMMQDWNNTYICMACANKFIPENKYQE